MKKKPTPRKRASGKTHAVIGSFGSASVLWGQGLGVRVEMFASDIQRIVEAVEGHFAEAEDAEAVKAANTLIKKLGRHTTKLRVSAEVVIAANGAKLEPILKTTGEKTTWEVASGEVVPAPRGYGMDWEA